MALFFEEFLAGFEKVELGDESVEMAERRARSTTGRTPSPRAAIRSATLRRISSGWATTASGDHGVANLGVGSVLAREDG